METVENVPQRRPVIRTYSKKAAGTAVLGVPSAVSATDTPRPVVHKVILHVNEPAPSVPSSFSGPPKPPSPVPSGGDHTSDEDYLDERPSHIWVNASRSRRGLRLDRQHLDDGAVRVRPVRSADTALVRVVNLGAYARGQAPRFTRGLEVRSTDILFVRLGGWLCPFLSSLIPFSRPMGVVRLVLGRACLVFSSRGKMSVCFVTAGRSCVEHQ